MSYGCTAEDDFLFCPCYGDFNSHYDSEDGTYSCGGYRTISEEELEKDIENFRESEDEYITFE